MVCGPQQDRILTFFGNAMIHNLLDSAVICIHRFSGASGTGTAIGSGIHWKRCLLPLFSAQFPLRGVKRSHI
jgi:hypothetical protein